MDSNTHSTQPPEPAGPPEPPEPPDGLDGLGSPDGLEGLGSLGSPEGLGPLVAVLDQLQGQDPSRLSATVRARRVLALRQLADRLDGHWLKELAGLDATGAAGADQHQPAASTAGWLRNRLRMGAGAAAEAVRCARALFGGPSPPPPRH